MKNLKLVLRNIKAYPLLKYGILTHLVLCIITISGILYYNFHTTKLLQETLTENQKIIESISIVNEGTKQQYFVIKSGIIKSLAEKQKQEYEQFLEKYFEHQSFYLNFWLSLLAIVLGMFAIIIPICFTKFLEDKRKDMDKIIRDCQYQKRQTEVNLKEMNEKLKQVESLTKEVQANSMLTEANQYDYVGDIDKAITVAGNSIAIKKTVANLSLRALFYIRQRKIIPAINDLEESIKIEKTSNALTNLGYAYMEIGQVNKAIDYIKGSIMIDSEISINYYNLTEGYIRLKDPLSALNYLKEFIKKAGVPFINDGDKENWKQWISEMPQDDNTKEMLKIIDKLQVRTTNEWNND